MRRKIEQEYVLRSHHQLDIARIKGATDFKSIPMPKGDWVLMWIGGTTEECKTKEMKRRKARQ